MINNPVDRVARKQFAIAIRRLVAGQITNDEFDDAVPQSRDPAVCAIFWVMWMTYSDLRTHKLIGRHRLKAEGRHIVARLLLFLYSDLPYGWPEIKHPNHFLFPRKWRTILMSLGFGKGWQARKDGYLKARDHTLWPFLDSSSYTHSLANPMLLGGTNRDR